MSKYLFFTFDLVFPSHCGNRNLRKKNTAITTGSLFIEMTDLLRLVRISRSRTSHRTLQYSSFDRRSQLPGGPDWFANSDGFGGEPIPGFESVLKEPDSEGIGEYLIADAQRPRSYCPSLERSHFRYSSFVS